MIISARSIWVPVIFLFALACFFGLFHITESPSLVFDEGWYFQTSANLASEGIDGLQFSPGNIEHISTFVTVGYPLIYPLALWFKIFSIGVLQGRLFMVLVLVGFITASYLLSRKIYGGVIAVAVLALLATFPPLYGNGKTVMGEVPGLLFLVLFMLCIVQARTDLSRKIFWLILAGLFAGLCVATKPIFIMLVPALCVGAFIEWRRRSLSGKEIVLTAIFFLVPLVTWLFVQFRPGDSLSTLLTYYANPYSLGNITDVILGNIRRLFSDIGTLYTVFLMFVWGSALFLRLRSRVKVSVEETVAFVFSIFIILAFLRTAGFYRYLFPAQVIALIFFPYSALYLSQTISRRFAFWHAPRMYAVLIVVLTTLGVYQLGFNSWVADTYSSRKTAFWQEYFTQVPDSESVFFYQSPEVVPFIQSRNYYQLLVLYDRMLGEEQLPVLTSGHVDKVIVPTNYFEADKGDVFGRYVEDEKAYKYSILKKR